MTKVLIFDRAPKVFQDLSDEIDPNLLQTREAQLSLGVFAKLLVDGTDALVRYSLVDPKTGLRYRSEGIMDEIHSAVESKDGLEVRSAVDALLVEEFGIVSLHGHDCNDCLIPLGDEPSESWQNDQALRTASARLRPTVILPTFEEVVAVSGAGCSSDYEGSFFVDVDALASGIKVIEAKAA